MSVKKIAQMAGTSPATVSRILNHPEYHAQDPELRARVWKAAMELNYVPNEAARSLRSGSAAKEEKTNYINVLLTRTEDARSDPFFSEVLRIIETQVHRSGSILHKVWYISSFSNERQCRRLNLDAMIGDLHDSTELSPSWSCGRAQSACMIWAWSILSEYIGHAFFCAGSA